MSHPSRTRLAIIPVGIAAALVVAAIAIPVHFDITYGREPASTPETARPSTRGDALLLAVSAASADVATRVKPSVVFITATERMDRDIVAAEDGPSIPPELLPLLPFLRGPQEGPRAGPPRGRAMSAGSGVIVSSDGYVLTNHHVVDGAQRLTIRLLDRREFAARVIGGDPNTDLAVLKIDAPDLAAASLGNSDSARVGDWVFAVGNPLGEALTFSVTSGIISAKGRVLDLPNRSPESIQDFIQTDAPINPGNSGGPLIDARGQVIGINAAIASPTGSYTGYGFAVPINLARIVMQQLVAHGHVARSALGVRVRDADADDAAYVALPRIGGVLVEDVPGPSSPAARAGVRPGDVIIAVDGTAVDHVAQMQEAIGFQPPGRVVALQIARKGGERVTLRVQLQGVPSDSSLTRASPAQRTPAPPDTVPAGAATPLLGVRVAPTDAVAIRELNLPPGVRGLVIVDVSEDSPAAGRVATPDDAGPDILLAVEGQPLGTAEALRAALRRAGPGAVVTLSLYNVPTRSRRIERVRLQTTP
ncbi:MAG TPA: trypsin-like peptidase domain-containing protein [Gemmatimonadaceae bacterium]|nr:trypsin-like peptidase domain-containing protein [Gemmatimonadaceae bacterium]